MKVIVLILMAFSYHANANLGIAGLNTIEGMQIPKGETEITIDNMPRVRSQDSVGQCDAFSASTLIDQANCQASGTLDCSSLPDEERASPLDLSRYSVNASSDDNARTSYIGLNEGGYTRIILGNALKTNRIAKESCAPFTQITSGIENPDAVEEGLWNRFRPIYEKNKTSTEAEFCPECEARAVAIQKEYGLKASPTDILKGFGQETYEKFLDKLLVPEACGVRKNALKLKGQWEPAVYPVDGSFSPNDTDKQKNDKTVAQLKKVLSELKRPISLAYCGDMPFNKSKKCEHGHAVVIKGYRKVCKKSDLKNCRNMFQVQNSWGQSWQDQNDNGWVDGDELMNRTYHENYTFSWLQDKKVEAAEAK